MNNILIIGNGFDSNHFNEIPNLEGINSFKSLKAKVENENKEILHTINNTQGINDNWKNLERVKPPLSEQDTRLLLSIVKDWSNDIDEKAKEYKSTLFKSRFNKIIKENRFIVLSLNYTNLIKIIYEVSKNNIAQLHVDDNNLPYMDFNNTYTPNNNFKKGVGLPTEIPESEKIPIGLEKEEEILKRHINNFNKDVNIYIYGASLNGVDFKYFENLIFYLDKKCKNMQNINIFIKKYGNNCEKWKNCIRKFFTDKPLKMNLKYNYIKWEEKNDGEWLNFNIKTTIQII